MAFKLPKSHSKSTSVFKSTGDTLARKTKIGDKAYRRKSDGSYTTRKTSYTPPKARTRALEFPILGKFKTTKSTVTEEKMLELIEKDKQRKEQYANLQKKIKEEKEQKKIQGKLNQQQRIKERKQKKIDRLAALDDQIQKNKLNIKTTEDTEKPGINYQIAGIKNKSLIAPPSEYTSQEYLAEKYGKPGSIKTRMGDKTVEGTFGESKKITVDRGRLGITTPDGSTVFDEGSIGLVTGGGVVTDVRTIIDGNKTRTIAVVKDVLKGKNISSEQEFPDFASDVSLIQKMNEAKIRFTEQNPDQSIIGETDVTDVYGKTKGFKMKKFKAK